MSSGRSTVCLECWTDYSRDIFHFDCTGEFEASPEEAAELWSWIAGRWEFVHRTGQVLGTEGAVV